MTDNADTSRAIILRGRSENYQTERATGDFLLSDAGRGAAGLTAVAAALAGSGGAIGLASMAGIQEIMNKIQFELDGKQMSGWLTWSVFQDGDEVEVVVEPLSDGTYRVFAILRPEDRMMALYPHCSRGRIAHTKATIRWFLMGFTPIYAVSCLIMLAIVLMHDDYDWSDFIFASVSGGLGAALIYGAIAFSISRKFMPFVRLAESIFSVLGWKDVAKIDLPARSKAQREPGDGPGLGTLYFRY